MKELFKAQKLHQEIIGLDKEIVKLESNLDKIIRDNLDGSIKLTINLNKTEKLKLDEDGSIVKPSESIYGMFTLRLGDYTSDKKDETKEEFKTDLSETELILMFATLLRHKQDKRISLIKDFNRLSLKLKI